MKKALSAALACVALGAIAFAQPAAAAPDRNHSQQSFMRHYCGSHPGDRDCWDWNHHRSHWNESRYHDWYGRHRREFGPDDAAAALFGFATGLVTGAINGAANGAANGSHTARCEAHYRSYNPRTDMFLGFDNRYHYCRL